MERCDENYLKEPPSRIFDSFLNTVEGLKLPIDATNAVVNTALDYQDAKTVTASGWMKIRNGDTMPFVAMISQV